MPRIACAGSARRGHRVEQPPRRRRADAGDQLRDAKTGQPAARVLHPAQHRQQVLHMRGLEKLQATELDERDVAPGQFEFQRGAVVAGAEQHRLALQREAAFAILQHGVGDPARLRHLVGHRHQPRAFAGLVAPQVLREALGRQRDHRIRGIEDRLRRAVVARQRDHLRRRLELGREVEDVAHLGSAKGVDRLRVVADHREAAAVGLQRLQDGRLQPVGVLVFVDQHVIEARADRRRQRRLGHRLLPVQQQVVVVEHLLLLLVVRRRRGTAASAHLPSPGTTGTALCTTCSSGSWLLTTRE